MTNWFCRHSTIDMCVFQVVFFPISRRKRRRNTLSIDKLKCSHYESRFKFTCWSNTDCHLNSLSLFFFFCWPLQSIFFSVHLTICVVGKFANRTNNNNKKLCSILANLIKNPEPDIQFRSKCKCIAWQIGWLGCVLFSVAAAAATMATISSNPVFNSALVRLYRTAAFSRFSITSTFVVRFMLFLMGFYYFFFVASSSSTMMVHSSHHKNLILSRFYNVFFFSIRSIL